MDDSLGLTAPHNCRRSGFSIYFIEHLAAHPVNAHNLHESLVLKINIDNKNRFLFPLYQSPK